jgi:hypothetical protein
MLATLRVAGFDKLTTCVAQLEIVASESKKAEKRRSSCTVDMMQVRFAIRHAHRKDISYVVRQASVSKSQTTSITFGLRLFD